MERVLRKKVQGICRKKGRSSYTLTLRYNTVIIFMITTTEASPRVGCGLSVEKYKIQDGRFNVQFEVRTLGPLWCF